ncbi:MAG: diguanylate cyclase [Gammaproteobacteria bacterium]|nr:diguanylate cyclase [Gammaproteobacteria bacterium]MBU1968509.1 diguanylate cyclase [Gammaproteobacteria bacterium]
MAASPAFALDKVSLQLKWTHAFQFAGYYAALQQGYYRDAGLDVNIVEASPATHPVDEVLQGRAQYGVGTSSLLLERAAGKPVVALAVVFQQSPYEIYAAPQIHNLRDLIGKRLMAEPQSDELLAYLKKEGIPIDSIKLIPHSFDANGLIRGDAEAITGYISDEPFYFSRAHYSYQTFSPRSVGIDFYGDNLFTSEKELHEHPARVKAFRAASLRGWQYAKEHPHEVIDLILAKYTKIHKRDYLDFESHQMVPLLQPNLIAIGYMNPERWQNIADTYADLGLMPPGYSLAGFLYDDTEPDLTWVYRGLAITLLAISLIVIVTLYVLSINRKLRISQQELSKSEKHYRLLVENMRDVVWILDPVTLRFRYVSPTVEGLRGFTAEEVMREPLDAALSPEYAAQLKLQIQRNVAEFISGNAPDQVYVEEICQPRKDGSWVWTEAIAKYYRNEETGQVEIHGVTRDISERKQQQEALKESETKLRALYESTSDAVMLLDEKGFSDCNPATLAMFGCASKEEFCTKHPADLSPSEQPGGASSRMLADQRIADAIRNGSQHFEWVHRRIDTGLPFPADVLLNAMNIKGRMVLQAVVRNITERKQAEDKIKHLAFYDTLTGLPNRMLLNDRLQQALVAAKREGRRGGLMFVDLDRFKQVNDTLGHDVGDELLQQAAARMQGCVRASDTVARIGGDEFIVLLRVMETAQDAINVAEIIRAVLRLPFELAGQQLEISCSIGIALYPEHGNDAVELSKHADIAMYRAKDGGRDSVCLYEDLANPNV